MSARRVPMREQTRPGGRSLLAYYWVAPLLAGLVLLAWLPWRAEHIVGSHLDLEVYRLGVRAWWQGGDPYGPLPATANGTQLPFIYPPFAMLALSPLALAPWEVTATGLAVANVGCLGVTLYLVAGKAWPALGHRGALAISSLALPAMLALEPVVQTFGYGQINIVLMALVAADCLPERTPWPRGVAIGIAAAIKLTPLGFVLFFLVRKHYRAAITAVVTAIAACALVFALDPRASSTYWFGGLAGAGGLSGAPYRSNQTIEAALVRLELPTGFALLGWAVLAALLLCVVGAAMRRSRAAEALLANAGLTLLISPISWSHHWVWVAPALVVMICAALRHARTHSLVAYGYAAAALVTGALCYLAPFHNLPTHDEREPFWTASQQIPGNTYVLLGLALLGAYAVARLRTAPSGTDCDVGSTRQWRAQQ